MKHLKLFENFDGDKYDRMDKKFPLTDKFMKDLVSQLASKGITPIDVTEPDYDVDGSIVLSDKVHLQIGLDNDISGIVEAPDGTFEYTDTYTDLNKVLSDLEKLKKKHNIVDSAKDASTIPLLNDKSTWEEIESYLKWLWNSPYQYHIDDDPEGVESFTPEEQKILRNNSDVMWGYNDRPENKDIDNEKMMNMLWDTYYVEDNKDVANEAANAMKDMSNSEKISVYRKKISDERAKPAPDLKKITSWNTKIAEIGEKEKKKSAKKETKK